MTDAARIKKKSTGAFNKRKTLFAQDDTLGKIEYLLAKELGKAKYKRPVSRYYDKGSFNFGGEVVYIKIGDDDKSVWISPECDDDNTYVEIQKFITEQLSRFEQKGAPPTEIAAPEPEEENKAMTVNWFEMDKAKKDNEKMKAGTCGKYRVFRQGNNIIPLESSFFDTLFGGMFAIIRAVQ